MLGVRLQLERDGRMQNFGASSEVDDATLLASAPDLAVGKNTVHLDGQAYRIALTCRRRRGAVELTAEHRRAGHAGTVAAAACDSRCRGLGVRLHRAA